MHYIYLAGPIAGQTYAGAAGGWREALSNLLSFCKNIQVLSPMRGKEFLQTHKGKLEAFKGHPEGVGGIATPRGTMSRDFADIDRSSVVVVGLLVDADRISVGTMIEIGYAVKARKPVILLHDRKAGNVHTHGWIFEAADFEVASVEEAAEVVRFLTSEGL